MEELYVVIGKDLIDDYSWICELDYEGEGCIKFKQMLTEPEALEFIKEFDDLVEEGNFSYKVAKLTFLD